MRYKFTFKIRRVVGEIFSDWVFQSQYVKERKDLRFSKVS